MIILKPTQTSLRTPFDFHSPTISKEAHCN